MGGAVHKWIVFLFLIKNDKMHKSAPMATGFVCVVYVSFMYDGANCVYDSTGECQKIQEKNDRREGLEKKDHQHRKAIIDLNHRCQQRLPCIINGVFAYVKQREKRMKVHWFLNVKMIKCHSLFCKLLSLRYLMSDIINDYRDMQKVQVTL